MWASYRLASVIPQTGVRETLIRAGNSFRRAEGEGHDGQRGVEAPVRHMQRAVADEKIIVAMNPAVGVRNAVLRIGTHSAGARLMLSCTQFFFGRPAPHALGAARPQPRFRFPAHELRGPHRFRMSRSTKTDYRQSEAIANVRVQRDPGVRGGDLLNRAPDIHAAPIKFTHRLFVGQAESELPAGTP